MIKCIVVLMLLIVSCKRDQPVVDNTSLDSAWAINRSKYNYTQDVKIEENEWKVISSIKPEDTTNILKVMYKDEIGLQTQYVYCKIIWQSRKSGDYKCTAPWMDKFKIIKSSNILELDIHTIDKKDAP